MWKLRGLCRSKLYCFQYPRLRRLNFWIHIRDVLQLNDNVSYRLHRSVKAYCMYRTGQYKCMARWQRQQCKRSVVAQVEKGVISESRFLGFASEEKTRELVFRDSWCARKNSFDSCQAGAVARSVVLGDSCEHWSLWVLSYYTVQTVHKNATPNDSLSLRWCRVGNIVVEQYWRWTSTLKDSVEYFQA